MLRSNKLVFVSGKPLQSSAIFTSKAGAYPSQVLPSKVGSGLIIKHYTRLESTARDRHSYLFCSFVCCNYKEKQFGEYPKTLAKYKILVFFGHYPHWRTGQKTLSICTWKLRAFQLCIILVSKAGACLSGAPLG
jgi:hypothetical protein